MNKLKLVSVALFLLASGATAHAGGLLTNTNQNIAFLMNPARDGVIAIDGVYSNPAGVAFLPDGWHFSLNIQSAYQTRTINSGFSVPAFQGTPFYQPFKLNGGDENGMKKFEGEASAPIIPSAQIAYNKGKWGFQGSFGLVGGGGKCTFNEGLGSFERRIAMLPSMLAVANQRYQQQYGIDLGLGTTTPAYSVESYIHGQQYVFGLQFGATYKLNEHWALYGGFRFNYILNKYEGNIKNINVNIGGVNENLYAYLDTKATGMAEQSAAATQAAATYQQLAEQATIAGNTALAQQYAAAAQQYAQGAALAAGGAQTMAGVRDQVADKYLECTQRGWAICPIVGVDFNWNKLNIGARLEFTTHFNIQNDTKVDDTGLFADGVNTPGDMPGIATIGAQYEILPSLRVMGGFHYYFDKNADMADDKQRYLSHNSIEWNLGAEYDILKKVTVSAGMQRTDYGLSDGKYLNDMSFVTDSYSYGFGAKIKVTDKVRVNLAYFWTNYSTFDKTYQQDFEAAGQTISTDCIDSFTRTNKVFGVGVDFDL